MSPSSPLTFFISKYKIQKIKNYFGFLNFEELI